MTEEDNSVYARIPRELVDHHIIDAIDGREMAAPIALLINQIMEGIPFSDFVRIRYVKTLMARAIKVAYEKGFGDGLTARAISETEQWETENEGIPEDLQTKRPKSTAEAVISIFDASCHMIQDNQQERAMNLPPYYITHPALGRAYDGRQGTTEFSYTREDGTVSQFDPNIVSFR